MYNIIYMDRISQYKTVQNEAIALFKKKNQDYGDSFANYGPIGVIVRMGDKINRLSSVTKSSVSLVKTESIRDTLIDLHNYSAMAIMLIDENEKKYSNEIVTEISRAKNSIVDSKEKKNVQRAYTTRPFFKHT